MKILTLLVASTLGGVSTPMWTMWADDYQRTIGLPAPTIDSKQPHMPVIEQLVRAADRRKAWAMELAAADAAGANAA